MADKKEEPKEPKEKKEPKVDYLPDNDRELILAKINKQITDAPVVKQYFDTWKELIDWTD